MPNIERFDDDKAAFFKQLESMRPDLMAAGDMPGEGESPGLIRRTRTKTNMLSAIPMKCLGPKCIYAQTCPLLAIGKAPIGEKCPIEMEMVVTFFEDLVEELNVDVSRLIEVSQVRDLVNQEIQHWRATMVLADEHFIQENPIGVDKETGEVILRKELHQAVDYEDRIMKRKDKIRNALMATREAKAKIGMSQTDGAQAIAGLLEEVRRHELETEKLIRKKLGLAEQDDYITDAEIVDDTDYTEDLPDEEV